MDYASLFNKSAKSSTTTISFSDYLKKKQGVAVEDFPKASPLVSNSPFNPKTPGNAEFNTQLDLKIPKPGLWNNFSLSDIGAGFQGVGLGIQPQDMGTTAGTVGGKPVPSTIPGALVTGLVAIDQIKPALRKTAFNTLVAPLLAAGAQVKQQLGYEGQIDLTKIGIPKVDSFSRNVQSRVDSGIPMWESIALETPNIIAAGMSLDAMATKSSLKLADYAQEKTTTPITFKDMQNITTGKENLVKPEVVQAYKAATVEHPELLGQIRKGTVEVPNTPKATLFSNFLKNAATRPISEISNIFNTFGRDISTPNTPLLAQTNEKGFPTSNPITEQATPTIIPKEIITPQEFSNLPTEISSKYLKFGDVYIVNRLPLPPAPLQLAPTKIGGLLNAPGKDFVPSPIEGQGFTMSAKPNKESIVIGKALNEYRAAVQTYNQKPTPTKLNTALKAKAIYEDLRQPKQVALNEQGFPTKSPLIEQPKAPVEAPTMSKTAPETAIMPKVAELPTPTEGNKISGIAQSINVKAIEQGMTDKGFQDLAEFNGTTFKEQADLVSKLPEEQAKAIVRGETPLPPEIRSAALISAMEDLAKKTGDVGLMQDLANSPLATKISESASEVSLARMREQDSATMKLQEIKKAREARAEKTKSAETRKIAKSVKSEVEKVNLSADELSWNRFLEDIKC